MSEDFKVVESGESREPTYDSSTHTVTEAGEKREPRIDESVRAAYEQHRSEKDPVFRKNGRTEAEALGIMEDFDNAIQRDPIDPYHLLTQRLGHNPQAVAQHLWNGTNSTGAASQAENQACMAAIARFDAKHSDPISKQLRPAAQKVIERGDKRLSASITTKCSIAPSELLGTRLMNPTRAIKS